MAVFPDISPILVRSQRFVHKQIDLALNVLPEPQYRAFIKSRADGRESNRATRSSLRWLLHNYFHYSGFLQCVITYQQQIVFTMGAEILPWQTDEVERSMPASMSGLGLSVLRHLEQKGEYLMGLEAVVPTGLLETSKNLLLNEIWPLAANYFFNVPALSESPIDNFMLEVEDFCLDVLNANIPEGRPVTVTHFRFQEMEVYFEMSGEHRSRDIMRSITALIRENLKKDDSLIEISPTSYLVLSPGAHKDPIERRFESIYFHIHGLILDYDLDVICLEDMPGNMAEIWRAIRL